MTPDTLTALVNLGSAGAVIAVVIIFLRSIKERDAEWRSFFTTLNSNNKDDICQLAEMMERMVASLDRHDLQAKDIKAVVDRIDKQITKPLPRKTAGS
jgi:hypothetical protein